MSKQIGEGKREVDEGGGGWISGLVEMKVVEG